MRCKQVREKLAEYQLGALDDAEAAAIAKHLAHGGRGRGIRSRCTGSLRLRGALLCS